MNKPKQLIIIGSGYSLNEGITKGLKAKIENKFTCGINYSYRYFNASYLCCMNYTDFYDARRKELKKLPLIITCNRPHPSKWERNTILINKNFALSGILALYIGILLEPKEIFLLGYDFSDDKKIKDKQNRPLTHFYQGDIEHRGIGKSQYYNYPGHAERDFRQFKNSEIKIYNVSLDSKIEVFPKISYDEFFHMLDNKTYNQKELVKQVCKKLKSSI